MFNLQEEVNKIVAAMLTQAWASTKNRETSYTEIEKVYEEFLGRV